MTDLPKNIDQTINADTSSIELFTEKIKRDIEQSGYEVVEINSTKPWGAYMRISNSQADNFIYDFFPDLSPDEARLGNTAAEVSPKILIVKPNQRLSLQTHSRRAERWKFLTRGKYVKGKDTDSTQLVEANKGDVIQFQKGDLHRLCGIENTPVVVAEIWQHTDSNRLSDEDDIVRLEDDYSR